MANKVDNLTLLLAIRNGVDWELVLDWFIQHQPELVINAITQVSANNSYQQVRDHARQGNGKVECIKLLRQLEGLGLKESKDWVDANIAFPPRR